MRLPALLCSLASLALASCAHAPRTCSDSNDLACGVGDATERRIAEPLAMAVIASRADFGELPAMVTFGGANWGRAALYLRFPPLSLPPQRIVRAFLRLEPATVGPSDARPVDVEVWRVRRDWKVAGLDWAGQPGLGPPRALARAEAHKPMRVDVTDLVREAEGHPERSHGLALVAAAGDGHGASFATGIDGAALPRLEVYLR